MRVQVGCFTFLLIFVISAIIGGFCWTYTINTWLLFAGKTATIAWWQGALIGLVPGLGQLSFPAAALTWIAMMFL